MAVAHRRAGLTVPRLRRGSGTLSRFARRLLVHAILLAGLAGVVACVYFVIVLGLGRVPTDEEKTLLVFSMIAAAIAALLYIPARARLTNFANRLVHGVRGPPGEVLRTLSSRLTRALPLDELLLQVAESLRRTLALEAAEVWTGAGGLLERAASDPERGPASLILTPAEEAVVARADVSGPTWLDVWLPQLKAGRSDAAIRVAPIAHSGELLGLIVAERLGEDEPFGEEDDRVLAELARQLGLALRNARLDSELQASLTELQNQAEELRASRARVVAAADAERRRIERDLHDGAQRHLVALAAYLRVVRELADTNPGEAKALLGDLSLEVQDALDELRDLAHGIYPSLLLDRGLVEALQAAISRAPMSARFESTAIRRHAPEVEATVYFCCLEALQNAAKHAGEEASARVRVWEEEGALLFEVVDDGVGFDPRPHEQSAGLINMSDRLGALGGRLRIKSAPGEGTRVVGTIPLPR